MSGGHFDILPINIVEAAQEIEHLAKSNPYQYKARTLDCMRDGATIMKLAAVYMNRIDYLIEADDDEDSFFDRLKEGIDELKREKGALK